MDSILSLVGMSADSLDAVSAFLFPILVAAFAVLILFANNSYKIFKFVLVPVGAAGFGYVGYSVVTPLVIDMIGEIAMIDLGAIIGAVFALIGALITARLYKFSLFLIGAGAGFVAGTIVSELLAGSVAFFGTPVGSIVLGAVCALIGALLFLWLFKFLYIVLTSIGSMAAAIVVAGVAIIPDATLLLVGIFAGVGAVIGIISAVKQFRRDA